MIEAYGYEKIKKLIQNVVILAQSWEDRSTFVNLKNILKCLKYDVVIMYPSNIVEYLCTDKVTQAGLNILNNINWLNPSAAIHSDLCEEEGRPKEIYWITNHEPKAVLEALGWVFPSTSSNEEEEKENEGDLPTYSSEPGVVASSTSTLESFLRERAKWLAQHAADKAIKAASQKCAMHQCG